MKTVFETLTETGGFTFDLVHQKYVKEGFAVSVNPERERVVKTLDPATLHTFVKDNYDLLFDTEAGKALGGWVNTDNNRVYLDIVTVFNDRDLALKHAQFHGEIAIYDLDSQEEIRV